MFFHKRQALIVAGALLATPACGGNGAFPSSVGANNAFSQVAVGDAGLIAPADNTSVLKKLKKDVIIGSTVDSKNGDKGSRDLSQVHKSFGVLKKGQLLVCNFVDSSGTAGNGTTIELLNPDPGSKPTTYVQSTKIKGCAGDAVSAGENVYGAGLSSGVVEKFNQNGKAVHTYGPPIQEPVVTDDADCSLPYAPESIYVGDAKTGSIVKFAAGLYGLHKEVAVITGFDVGGSGWGARGPEGIQYNKTLVNRNKCNDTLYITDGVDNTLVAVTTVSNLLTTGEIVVQPGGKTFKCRQKKFSCASLVYSGSPLNSPVALALLPNGNLVVANGGGGNTLVEISAAGTVLATKTLNSDKTPEIFGLLAAGTGDANTTLFYTDSAHHNVHELEP
jgi:hypothetical protein